MNPYTKKVFFITIALLLLFAACDNPHYRIVIEEVVPEEEDMCWDCCTEDEPYNPNLVDPYSEDTNWYIDDVGNIIWKH